MAITHADMVIMSGDDDVFVRHARARDNAQNIGAVKGFRTIGGTALRFPRLQSPHGRRGNAHRFQTIDYIGAGLSPAFTTGIAALHVIGRQDSQIVHQLAVVGTGHHSRRRGRGRGCRFTSGKAKNSGDNQAGGQRTHRQRLRKIFAQPSDALPVVQISFLSCTRRMLGYRTAPDCD